MQNPSLGIAQRIMQWINAGKTKPERKEKNSEGINNKSLGYQLFHIRFNLLLYRGCEQTQPEVSAF